MASLEFLAIIIAFLGLAAAVIYYAMTLRDQSKMMRTQLQIEKQRGSLEMINKQIEFYSELDGRLGEDDIRKIEAPMSFIAEKFNQAQVKEKYNDLALVHASVCISEFYSGRIIYQNEKRDLLQDLLSSVHGDLELLKKKRQVLLEQ